MVNFRIRVRNLVRKYNTRNPIELAKMLGIIIIEKFLSEQMPKGIFKKILGKKFIIINLTRIKYEFDKKYVIAHELAHALYHSSDSAFFMHDHTLYPRGKFEIEADTFAAELLINEKDIDSHSLKGMCTSQVATYFGVPKQLVEYKFVKAPYKYKNRGGFVESR